MAISPVIKKISLKQFCIHCILWSIVLLFYTQFLGFQTDDYYKTIGFSFFLMPVTIGTTYVVIYHLIPRYLLPKRYLLLLIYGIYTLIVSAYLIVLSIYGGLIFLSNLDANQMLPITKSLLLVFIGVYLIVFIASSFSLLQYNQLAMGRNHELKQQVLERELQLNTQKLNYLKMQIHPHFLFNTLNTLYGFALKKSDETPEMILKLSNLLDYLLYQVEHNWVTLKQEVEHIQDYIALEKMRFQKTLKVDFLLEGDWENVLVAPMLLLPFVENAFKHGSMKQEVLGIKINLKIKEQQLYFSVQNTTKEPLNQQENKGIGLQNIQKRLDLLYKNQYCLDITSADDLFTANLYLDTTKRIL